VFGLIAAALLAEFALYLTHYPFLWLLPPFFYLLEPFLFHQSGEPDWEISDELAAACETESRKPKRSRHPSEAEAQVVASYIIRKHEALGLRTRR